MASSRLIALDLLSSEAFKEILQQCTPIRFIAAMVDLSKQIFCSFFDKQKGNRVEIGGIY